MYEFFTRALWSPYVAGAGIRNPELPCIPALRPAFGVLYGFCKGTGDDRKNDQPGPDFENGLLPRDNGYTDCYGFPWISYRGMPQWRGKAPKNVMINDFSKIQKNWALYLNNSHHMV